MALTVLAYQRFPPRAVGTPSAFNAWAILGRLAPAFRICRMRSRSSSGIERGRPSFTPCARFAASASLVRWPMILRSNWAADACAPDGDGTPLGAPR